ncbi:uncharacterized protein LOC135289660 isoform X2 [Passer domesticus]|uniref:uncharacterized protein LOC135289660 isoform X2 n=1 Tax=Passer domesticus TaxID=48849 RepID=UPI0030FE8C1C
MKISVFDFNIHYKPFGKSTWKHTEHPGTMDENKTTNEPQKAEANNKAEPIPKKQDAESAKAPEPSKPEKSTEPVKTTQQEEQQEAKDGKEDANKK